MSKQLQFDLNERFYIFDNFLTGNQNILDKYDDKWTSDKILFQLAINHANTSPLTKEAQKYLNKGIVDWNFCKLMNRAEKFISFTAEDFIDIGYEDNEIKKKIELYDEKILYFIKDSNDMLLYEKTTKQKILLDAHEYEPFNALAVDENTIISIDKVHNYSSLIVWKNYIPYNKTTLYNVSNIIKLDKDIAVIFTEYVEFIPIDKLGSLLNNIENITNNDSSFLTQEEIDELLNIVELDDCTEVIEDTQNEVLGAEVNFIDIFKEKLVEVISSFTGISPTLDISKKEVLDYPVVKISVKFTKHFESSLLILFPISIVIPLVSMVFGGEDKSKDSMEDDDIELFDGILSTVLESIQSNIVEMEIDSIEVYNKNENLYPYKQFYEFTYNGISSTLSLQSEFQDIFDLKVHSVLKDNEFENKDIEELDFTDLESVEEYGSIDTIVDKVKIDLSPTSILEFKNGNKILYNADRSVLNVYDVNGTLIYSVDNIICLGIDNNRLYLKVQKRINIYDENMNLIDTYEIEDESRFKYATVFQDKIITSEDIIKREGILALEKKNLDSEMIVWNRGKIDKIITDHMYGCSTYIENGIFVSEGCDGKRYWDENFNQIVDGKDDSFVENMNINAEFGFLFEEGKKVLTYGFKHIYTWDKNSYEALNLVQLNNQIVDLKIINSIVHVKEKVDEETKYRFYDLELNDLELNELDSLGESLIVNYSKKHNFDKLEKLTFLDKKYSEDFDFKEVEKYGIIGVTYLENIFQDLNDKTKTISVMIIGDSLYLNTIDTNGNYVNHLEYKNKKIDEYELINKNINYYQYGDKLIFWLEYEHGEIIVMQIYKGELEVNIFRYELSDDIENRFYNMDNLEINEDKYIFSYFDSKVVFDKEGKCLEILEYSSNNLEKSITNDSLSYDEKKAMLAYSGAYILDRSDNGLIINDYGRIRYLEIVGEYTSNYETTKI